MAEYEYTERMVLNWAEKCYSEWNADFAFNSSDTALLVIDIQDEFVKPGMTPYWAPQATKIVPDINELISFCRKVEIPIIHTLFTKTHNYKDRPRSGRYMPNRYRNLDIDQSGFFVDSKLYDELDYREDDILIRKPSYGAFYDTPLETVLKNYNRDTVIISGCLTNYCCGTTARQAYERGYKVVFGSDITATDLPEMHENELKVLRKGFARIMCKDDIIEALS